jgi:hypothetical protein
MTKPTDPRTILRESIDRIDELMGFKHPKAFGQKTEPSDQEIENKGQQRLKAVADRANTEKKSYGFLRSLKSRVFGKKTPEYQREPRSPEERLKAIAARAKQS